MKEGGQGVAIVSGYEAVWMFALFDLPVKTQEQRRDYSRFRKSLQSRGFCMLQFSVYARHFFSEEAAEPYKSFIHSQLPPAGQVRLLTVTEKQFGRQEVFFGGKREEGERPPEQMMLF